jgi:hypothetical protein
MSHPWPMSEAIPTATIHYKRATLRNTPAAIHCPNASFWNPPKDSRKRSSDLTDPRRALTIPSVGALFAQDRTCSPRRKWVNRHGQILENRLAIDPLLVLRYGRRGYPAQLCLQPLEAQTSVGGLWISRQIIRQLRDVASDAPRCLEGSSRQLELAHMRSDRVRCPLRVPAPSPFQRQ